MAKNFIQFNGNIGFWIPKVYMQLLFHYVNDEISKPYCNFVQKNQLIYNLQFHIDGYSAGFLSLDWKGYLDNSEINTMMQVLQNVKATIQNKGTFIAVSELQAIPTEDWYFKIYYQKSFPTSELIKIVDALIQMLQDTWTSTNYSMDINYK